MNMIIQVKVKLYSREAKLEKLNDGNYIAYLTKIPDKGKANDELVGLLAREFGIGRDKVVIKTPTGRKKIVEIDI